MAVIADGEYILICDAARSGGKVTTQDLADVAASYDPQLSAAPAIVGHTSSYPKDTRIPAGAWIEKVKLADSGNKLLAKLRYVGDIPVRAPKQFEELQDMAQWFPEAVNAGLYQKRSVGIMKRQDFNGGKAYLHHLAFLGAKLPQVKGMPDVELAEEGNKDFSKYYVECSADESITEIEMPNLKVTRAQAKAAVAGLVPAKLKLSAAQKVLAQSMAARVAELAEDIPIDGVTTGDPDAEEEINTLLEALREMFKLPPEANIGMILGAVLAEQQENSDKKMALAGAAASFLPPSMITPVAEFSEDGAKIPKWARVLNAKMDAVMKELDDTPPAPAAPAAPAPAAPAPGTPPAAVEGDAAVAVVPLGLPADKCQNAADAAVQQLKDNNSWLPAFDDAGFPALFAMLANVKYADKSALDALVTGLQSLPNLSDLSEFEEYAVTYEENRKKVAAAGIATVATAETLKRVPSTMIALGEGEVVEGLEEFEETTKYAREHNISYEEADTAIHG